jgi:hypothetical protein
MSHETPETALVLKPFIGRKKHAFPHPWLAWELLSKYMPLIDTVDDLEWPYSAVTESWLQGSDARRTVLPVAPLVI